MSKESRLRIRYDNMLLSEGRKPLTDEGWARKLQITRTVLERAARGGVNDAAVLTQLSRSLEGRAALGQILPKEPPSDT